MMTRGVVASEGEGTIERGQSTPDGTVNLSSPRAIFAGSPPRFTRSRVESAAIVAAIESLAGLDRAWHPLR